ncbi:nuclear pore complex protein Nup160 homolog [Drosophila guanche]|uniref:Blast:Replication factor C subunit 3 n=1 Tax=Drosophila guanche TaxID=7266 RepID=A0A3B0K7I2_DROGU|nr:nuclear pore complex protein Nup160 homolog [Drosophila guanche]SPP79478.1 blast:Replication factor C subunit 3 [Drosophila guanche]
MNFNMSYREVTTKNLKPADWTEVNINTETLNTLQDTKTFEISGGHCYKNTNVQYRNRFIYWRTNKEVLELAEISLDISLVRNHLRMRFTDSAVLNVSLTEHSQSLTLLVVTVSSVHRYVFPLKVVGTSEAAAAGPDDLQSQSIFYDVNEKIDDPRAFYVTDGLGTMPTVAASFMSEQAQVAYFAVAYQNKLVLHVMNCVTGTTVTHEVKEPHLMPRFLSSIAGALTRRAESVDAPNSMAFSEIDGKTYLLVVYRSNELRLWSLDTMQTVSTINCCGEPQSLPSAQGPQTNQIRKVDDENFCVFLSHDDGADFVCVQVGRLADENPKGLELILKQHVVAPQMDLADFDVTLTHIWALWSNAEGDFNVSTIYFGSNQAIEWVSSVLEPPPDRYCLTMEQGIDPREAYCSYIFHPGRFDRTVIIKALYMFRRVNLQFDVRQMSMTVLKEQVCQAVEDEIQNEFKEFVVSDEEYLEIASRLWDHFYSCCEQYHIKYSEPIGLSILGPMDAACLIRRQSFALLRPCEPLEHILLIGEQTKNVATILSPFFRNDHTMSQAFAELIRIITLVEKSLPEDVKMEFDKKLYQRETPINVVAKLVSRSTEDDDICATLPQDTVEDLKIQLQNVTNLQEAVDMLLNILCVIDPETPPPQDYGRSTRFLLPTGALLGSEYGISILAETFKQMALIRFSVCRDLLILLYIMTEQHSSFLVTVNNYMQSYYTLVWMAVTPISSNTPAGFEASIQRLSRAQLFDGYSRPYSSHVRGYGNDQTTLLCLFLRSKGLFSALSRLLKESGMELETEPATLRQTLLQLVTYTNQMLWPDSPSYVFPEWLFGTCHQIIVQDYVRLLAVWCKKKADCRTFMLAVSLLDCGETQKALLLFQDVAEKVLDDAFLIEHVLKNTPLHGQLKEGLELGNDDGPSAEHKKQALVHYYLKVIQLFEQYSAVDYIIQLALKAISKLADHDPQLPMFQSIVFNNHMHLGHYEEAYHALIYNADISRRKDCLRQLVVTLFQCKSLDLLMKLPYSGLQNEFENIVESRARSLSIDQNEVYNFLYAFHTSKGNMRKAATVMYEQAMRLQVSSNAPEALEKRCSSLLVCVNCLNLVDSRYRWIAKPIIGDERVLAMDVDNEDDLPPNDDEVVVLELADIRRELVYVEALKELSYYRKDIAAYELTGAEELSYLLTSYGLYTAALKLSRGHSFPVQPIFESLAAACVSSTEEKATDSWAWLQNNDLADLPHRNNAADMAWSLLQKLILDNERKDSTLIRKGVVNRLLTMNAFVPKWLYDSYKLSNSRELLQLYVKHNRLLEAADMASEMICAMLGAGSEYFDFQQSINVTTPQLAFPINTIDLLLHALKVNGKEQSEYEVACVQLEDDVARYIETVSRTTADKMKMAILRNREERQQQALLQ